MRSSDDSKTSNPILAIEFDTIPTGIGDLTENHVGIDINSLRSAASKVAAYYIDESDKKYISLVGGGVG